MTVLADALCDVLAILVVLLTAVALLGVWRFAHTIADLMGWP